MAVYSRIVVYSNRVYILLLQKRYIRRYNILTSDYNRLDVIYILNIQRTVAVVCITYI
jgi:hypothetical protein